MKVRFQREHIHAGERYQPGDEAEVPDRWAEHLLARKWVTEVKKKARKAPARKKKAG